MPNLYGPYTLTPDLLQPASSSQFNPTVAQLQELLNSQGYTDPQGKPLAVDGVMGPLTQYALDQKARATTQALSNYYGPDMSMPTAQQIPNVVLRDGYAVTDRGGVFQGITPLPKPSATATAPTPSPAQYGVPSVDIGAILSRLQAAQAQGIPDVRTTPDYAAAQQRLEEQGQRQGSQVVQRMAAMGRLKSARTDEALKQIARDIARRLEVDVTPQIQQQLEQQRQRNIGNILAELQAAMSMQQFGANQQAAELARQLQAQQFMEGQRQFDIEQMYRNAQLQQKAQEFAAGLRESQADRALRQQTEADRLKLLREQFEFEKLPKPLSEKETAIQNAWKKYLTGGLEALTYAEQQLTGLTDKAERDLVKTALDLASQNIAFNMMDSSKQIEYLRNLINMLRALYEGQVTPTGVPNAPNVTPTAPAQDELSDEEIRRILGY